MSKVKSAPIKLKVENYFVSQGISDPVTAFALEVGPKLDKESANDSMNSTQSDRVRDTHNDFIGLYSSKNTRTNKHSPSPKSGESTIFL